MNTAREHIYWYAHLFGTASAHGKNASSQPLQQISAGHCKGASNLLEIHHSANARVMPEAVVILS